VVGLHICGNLLPILEDVLATGANLVDIDHQVAPGDALAVNRGRAVLRGNLDPSSVFAFGTLESIERATASLRTQVEGAGHWVYSSGCDISPGTPSENLSRVLTALGGKPGE
jgi:uroporphyrinogen decarboxylase